VIDWRRFDWGFWIVVLIIGTFALAVGCGALRMERQCLDAGGVPSRGVCFKPDAVMTP